MLSFGEAIKVCFQKYAVFSGRAKRSEYWWFQLFLFLTSLIFSFFNFIPQVGIILSGICSLAFLLPSIAVTVRRLHDVGKSGWLIFLPLIGILFFIPLINILISYGLDLEEIVEKGLIYILCGSIYSLCTNIFLFVLYLTPSQKDENKYGPEQCISLSNTALSNSETSKKSGTDELIKLKKLLDDSIITQEDFDKKKTELLDRI